MQSRLLLCAAILFEVAGTTAMKASSGFTRLIPSVLLFIFYALSFVLLTFSLKKLDVGFVYAIWSGLGTTAIAIIGVMYFGESINALKIISIMLIIAGVVGLNLSGTSH